MDDRCEYSDTGSRNGINDAFVIHCFEMTFLKHSGAHNRLMMGQQDLDEGTIVCQNVGVNKVMTELNIALT